MKWCGPRLSSMTGRTCTKSRITAPSDGSGIFTLKRSWLGCVAGQKSCVVLPDVRVPAYQPAGVTTGHGSKTEPNALLVRHVELSLI